MNHNINLDKEFILRIIIFGLRATIRSIIAEQIKIGFFNFINVLRFNNYDGMKIHFILKEVDLEVIRSNLSKELGLEFVIVDNTHSPLNPLELSWNSSVESITRGVLWCIEHRDTKPPGVE